MAIEQRQMAFSYASLAPDVRARVETATRRLHDLERRTSESIIEMGQHLIEVKAAIGHGNFLPWLEAEFGWSDRVAAHLMNVAVKFENFSNLESVSPSALYVLAAPSTPDEVRVEFTELAALGQKVTHKDVKAAIKEVKSRADNDPPRNTATVDRDTGEIVDDDYPDAEVVDPSDPSAFVWEPPPQPKSSPTPEPEMVALRYRQYRDPEQRAGSIAAAIRAMEGENVARLVVEALNRQM